MKRTLTILRLATILLFIGALIFVEATFGWFAKLVVVPKGEIGVGDITYSLTGAFIADDTLIVPGQELIQTPFVLDNNSSVDSQIRMKITYLGYVWNGVEVVPEEQVYVSSEDDFLFVTVGTGFEVTGDYWYFSDDPLIEGPDYVIDPETGIFTLLTSVFLNGATTNIDFADEVIWIRITVEVKQADNVTWSELVDIDFSTGEPITP
jgi:hypothetical protein